MDAGRSVQLSFYWNIWNSALSDQLSLDVAHLRHFIHPSDNFRGQNKIFLLQTTKAGRRSRYKFPPILKLGPEWSSGVWFPTLYLYKEKRHLLHSREAMKFGAEEILLPQPGIENPMSRPNTSSSIKMEGI